MIIFKCFDKNEECYPMVYFRLAVRDSLIKDLKFRLRLINRKDPTVRSSEEELSGKKNTQGE